MFKTFKILGAVIFGLVLGLAGTILAGGSILPQEVTEDPPKVIVEGDYIEAPDNCVSQEQGPEVFGGVTYDASYLVGDVYQGISGTLSMRDGRFIGTIDTPTFYSNDVEYGEIILGLRAARNLATSTVAKLVNNTGNITARR